MRIDVPWGTVAGQWYGSSENRPIVMLHGWQDNAGTFERLIPLLPPNHSYLTIDLPGHGFSSHIPHGMHYSLVHYIHTLKLIQRHYNWEKMSLIGHSMGGMVCSLFTILNPDQCDILICVDGSARPFNGNVAQSSRRLQRLAGNECLALLQKQQQQDNTKSKGHLFDDIVDRWSEQITIDKESIKCLMRRGVTPSPTYPDRFNYTRDMRLKVLDFGLDALPEPVFKALTKQINIPHLFIKAAKSRFYEDDQDNERVLEIYAKGNEQFVLMIVNEGHHLHLTHPQLISKHLSSFIEKCRP